MRSQVEMNVSGPEPPVGARERVVIVTGGTRGIGLAIAEHFVSGGARVVLSSLSESYGASVADELNQAAGHEVASHARSDVSDRAQVEALVRLCVERYGRLDIVVANAGIDRGAPFLKMTEDDWDVVMRTDLRGAFLTMLAGARQLVLEGHGGRIIAIASTNAFWVESNLAAYNVAKAGIVALVRTAAIELAPHGVTVNAVGPGLIETRMTAPTTDDPHHAAWYRDQIPLGRFGQPSDVAAAVGYLASDAAAWVTGQHLVVDGGQTAGINLPLSAITPG